MKIDKDKLAQLAAELDRPFGCCKLRCDGFEVDAVKKLISKTRIALVVYVNGEWKGEWFKGGEIPEKFHYASKHYLYKKKAREEADKQLKKRGHSVETKEFWTKVRDGSTTMWQPYWGSSAAFLRQIQKTCASIEIVSIGYTTQ